jgi:hypothetical protein
MPDRLTVEDVARLHSWSLRTARRRVSEWAASGAVRVVRQHVPGARWRLLVERASYDAYCDPYRCGRDEAA